MEDVVAPQFWQGKRVFLTGHTGFKGAWLALWLEQLGAHVTGFALAPEAQPNLFEAAGVANGITSIIGDIRNLNDLEKTLAKASPDVVFHLAAQSLVRESYDDPVGTFATNVMGTANLLDAARRTPSIRALVNVTSDKCYAPAADGIAHDESDPMGGDDPYSASKGASELATHAWRHAFFAAPNAPAIATVRAGNVIGGGDWAADRLIPDIMRAWTAEQPVHIRNPNAVRPWQHVLEPLAGYLALAERLCGDEGRDFAEGWNFGPNAADMKPVRWIVETLAATSNTAPVVAIDEGPHPHENPALRLNSDKALTRLGWKPKLGLKDALDWTYRWYQGFADADGNARALTLGQIKAYMDRGQK